MHCRAMGGNGETETRRVERHLASPSLGHYATLSFVVIGRILQIASESFELNGFNEFNGFNAFNELTNSLINKLTKLHAPCPIPLCLEFCLVGD